MVGELDLLGIVSRRLDDIGIAYMLTGSFALAYYATPRMTRDLDFVVALEHKDIGAVVRAFSRDFYIDADAASDAIAAERMFNLMHLESGIKVDFIVRKHEPYRIAEFERRCAVRLGEVDTWIVSREDLVLSKLVWGSTTGSELQRRDVLALIDTSLDHTYIRHWAVPLGVASALDEVLPP